MAHRTDNPSCDGQLALLNDREKLREEAKKVADMAELHRRAGDDYFAAGRPDLAKNYYELARLMDQACNLLCKLTARTF